MTHEGPQYHAIDPSIKPDNSSYTEIQLFGDAPSKGFSWLDGFEKLHFVNVSSAKPEIKVIFPVSDSVVMFRANNIDNSGMDLVRTACGPHHKWCEATFMYKKQTMWQGEQVKGNVQFYTEEKYKCPDLPA